MSIASSVSVSVPIWLTLISIELATPVLDALLQPRDVGHEEVVANKLDVGAEPVGQQAPAVPVVLGHAVLDRDDRVAGGPLRVEADERRRVERPALAFQRVLAVRVELAGGRDRARSQRRGPAS